MSPRYYLAVAATAIAVVALLLSEQSRASARRAVAKPLASAGFVVAAWHAGATDSTYGRIVFGGLVLAALGDVLLLPRGRRFFVAGLVSFLLAHVAFCAAFVQRGVSPAAALIAAMPLAALAGVIWRWLVTRVPSRLVWPIAAYTTAITAMVALAVGTTWPRPAWPLLAGVFAFYISDLSVARDKFVVEELNNKLWGLPLYYAGQLLIAASVASP
jgi:uncharacterized membrane protein YhhN